MPPESADTAPSLRRRRAKMACKTCNSRRVRCNVLEMRPCANCAAADIACELLPSRRGKYQRKKPQNTSPSVARSSRSEALSPSSPQPQFSPSVGAAGLPSIEQRHSVASHTGIPSPQASPQAGGIQTHDVGPQANASEVAQAQAAETHIVQTQTTETQAMDRTLFFGESNFLTCVAGERFGLPQPSSVSTQPKNRLSYPISDAINLKASKMYAARNPQISSLRHEYLRSEGAFTYPELQDSLQVLRAYFRWFHPCFPILDRSEIAGMVKSGEISPLLYQAILFVGTSYCDEETVHRMGFRDRPEAKAKLYNRARLLFDADWESNKVAVLQSLFLMSFWRAGPLNEKNSRYWLGAAIGLAQTRGFHRAAQSTTVGAKQAKMRRRIWWSIYVRDRQSSASLGLPSRIRDEDCDVQMLSPLDLEEEEPEGSASDIFGNNEPGHILYALEMAKLAKLLGKIITNQFTPGDSYLDKDERSRLSEALVLWKSELPENMRECNSESRPGMIWTYLLHLAYNNLHIYLHRRAYVRPLNEGDTQAGQVALQAARRITRIVEDMLSQDLVRFGQLHVLFASLCIHTISLQRSKDTTRRLAEHRAQMCLLGLKEIQKYWEVNNLVLELFFQYLDESTAKRLRASELEPVSEAVPENNPALQPVPSQQSLGPNSSLDEVAVSPLDHAGLPHNQELSLGTHPAFSEDTLFLDMPQNLYQNSTADPYAFLMDSQTPINDGLDMQGLQFLQRCL
ncbi:hypothetical protein P152DRAFT_3545 [Eremomyces bilateralis CBS 781.70]|uniref:Zn(2)-C6 fungal-type domain-containing protein n=1 Tax=Eremomyces bilateralis CBS 781.70 TaxID=1392243 RepID=A0A6G1GFP7_9PEZI|nr:uncharacterized protein P152DRAFT_3545 [Eremomyces bilateralis CBS 781.70]KAF1816898.1 hypothetical protein P152DRAFT_3545 [Eremomyces bilateralis CBS 781.70]